MKFVSPKEVGDAKHVQKNVMKNNSLEKFRKLDKRYFKWILLALLFLAIIIIPISILISIDSSDSKICITTSCIQSAELSLKYLNTAVDPCNDFYEFACGNFPKTVVLTEDKPYQSISTLMLETVVKQLRTILNQLQTENQPNYYKETKKLYNLCLNQSLNKTKEIETVKWTLQYFGDWPVIQGSGWNESNFDLLKIIQISRQLGILQDYFISVRIIPDITNSTKFSVTIDVKKALTSRFANDFEFPIEPFNKNVKKLALLYGGNKSVIDDYVEDVSSFERKLRMRISSVERNDKIRLKIKHMKIQFSKIDWVQLIKILINNPNIVITGEEYVTVTSAKSLDIIIMFLNTFSKRQLVNYVFFEIVRWANQHYYGKLNLRRKEVACSRDISNSMNIAVGAMYVRKHTTLRTKTEVTKLLLNIQKEFENVFKTTQWLDEVTKKNALEKLEHMKSCVAYPDELLDDQIIEKYYSKLNINYTSFLNAIMSINRYQQDKSYKRLEQPLQDYLWADNSAKVLKSNADYDLVLNSLMLPAAFLQQPVFNFDRPHYMNYAVIGMIIGHEIMHGFDENGKDYHKDGTLKMWFSNTSFTLYNVNKGCFSNQYENYIDAKTNLNINGITTELENIADNCGVKVSYATYDKWVNLNGNEKILPGLNFTVEQLFWIIYSQYRCSYNSDDYMKYLVTLRHVPNKFRVIGTVSNFKIFSKHFNCPLDSPMNPKVKCKVW